MYLCQHNLHLLLFYKCGCICIPLGKPGKALLCGIINSSFELYSMLFWSKEQYLEQ